MPAGRLLGWLLSGGAPWCGGLVAGQLCGLLGHLFSLVWLLVCASILTYGMGGVTRYIHFINWIGMGTWLVPTDISTCISGQRITVFYEQEKDIIEDTAS